MTQTTNLIDLDKWELYPEKHRKAHSHPFGLRQLQLSELQYPSDPCNVSGKVIGAHLCMPSLRAGKQATHWTETRYQY